MSFFRYTYRHTPIWSGHSWGGECEVWPIYPLSYPWGSMQVQYSGDVPLCLLICLIQYETRLEGHLLFIGRHTHTHSQAHCMSLTCARELSWLLMCHLLSHRPRSLSFSAVTHTRLLPNIPRNKPQMILTGGQCWFICINLNQEGSITFPDNESNMAEILTEGGCSIRMWFYLAEYNQCRFVALKLLSPWYSCCHSSTTNTHLQTFSLLPPPHQNITPGNLASAKQCFVSFPFLNLY